MDKVNSYFGYKLIDEIKIQTFGFEKDKKNERRIKEKFTKNLQEKINKIRNESLKNSLSQLLKTIKNES